MQHLVPSNIVIFTDHITSTNLVRQYTLFLRALVVQINQSENMPYTDTKKEVSGNETVDNSYPSSLIATVYDYLRSPLLAIKPHRTGS